MMARAVVPVLEERLRGARDISRIVRVVTGHSGLAGLAQPPSSSALELIGLGLAEVLRTVLGLAGSRRPAGVAVELWVEPRLAIITVRLAGAAVPEWLLANWDRGHPPAVLAPPGDCGWGWLLVRESLDSVVQLRGRQGNLLFLERRL